MDNWSAVEIADALVAAINAETWPQTLTAVRLYAPVRSIKEVDRLCVTVLPFETANPQLVDRRPAVKEEITVSINVQKEVTGPECNDEIDPLTKLVQDIADFCRLRKTETLSSGVVVAFMAAEIAFDFAGLRDPVIFAGWTNLTYKIVRA